MSGLIRVLVLFAAFGLSSAVLTAQPLVRFPPECMGRAVPRNLHPETSGGR